MFVSYRTKGLCQPCQSSVLERFDGSDILVHQVARFLEIEAQDESINDHVTLILCERRESRGDLAESKALVDGIQRVDRLVWLDVAPFDLRMPVLRPEVIDDLAVRDLEEPGDEFAFAPAAEPVQPAKRGEVDLLEKVFSGGLHAQARQEVTENASIGRFVQAGEGVGIPPARSIQQVAICGRSWVLIA
jgi:hypothetical protein